MIHRPIGGAVRLLARAVLLGFFRRVEITGHQHLVDGRPTLVVANHFNGFVDPVVLAVALGRFPRFVAKASLTSVPGLGLLMRALGVVFVERPQDHDGTAGNVDAFASCREALAAGDMVAIFPEGTTHDEARLAPVRTGTARIALGARAGGLDGLQIVPVGLTFPDKLALRSSVLVRIGAPIDLDALVPAEVAALGSGAPAERTVDAPTEVDGTGPGSLDTVTEPSTGGLQLLEGPENHTLVTRVTDEIGEALRRVAPDYEDVEEWHSLEYTAEVSLRHPDEPEPDLAARAVLAHRLGRAPAATRERVRRSIADYNLSLTLARLHDREVAMGLSSASLAWSAVVAALMVVVLGPIALFGLTVNAIPVALVFVASWRVKVPVTKGTVRLLVALVTLPVAWIIAAWPVADDWWQWLVLMGIYAVGGFAAVLVAEQVINLVRRALAWHSIHERRALIEPLQVHRAEVAEVVRAALLETGA